MKLQSYVLVAVLLIINTTNHVQAVATAPFLTTTNIDVPQLIQFKERTRTNRSMVISFGDSMADSYRSIAYWFMAWWSHDVGIAGYALNNYGNNNLIYGTAGVYITDVLNDPLARNYWFNNYAVVPPGEQLWWEKQYSPNGVYCDQQGFFFVKHPNGGPFAVYASTNGGSSMLAFTADGYTSDPDGEGCFTNLTFPTLNYYKIYIESIAGTNFILGRFFENSQASGTIATFMDRGGIHLGMVTNVSPKIREPVFSELYRLANSNALMIWHMKEPVDQSLSIRMSECASIWSNTMPDMTVVYCGTPLTKADDGYLSVDTITVQQNSIVRAFALNTSQPYVDCMNPSISYEWMLENGFIGTNDVHQTWLGNQYFGSIVWDTLFDVVKDLSITQNTGYITVSHDRSIWGKYLLQSSTNMINWVNISSSSGTTNSFSLDVMKIDPVKLFRLESGPP